MDELPITITADEALALGPEIRPGSIALAVGGDDLGLIPVAMDEVGNGVLVTGPRRSGRSTALAFGARTALAGGARLVLVLPRRSPVTALGGRDGVAAVLGPDTKPNELRDALKERRTETLLVVDDFDVLGNDHPLGPVFEEHLKACRDAPGGVLITCGIDEIGGMYRGIIAQVRKNRTGLILAPRNMDDGAHLSVRLPRSRRARHDKRMDLGPGAAARGRRRVMFLGLVRPRYGTSRIMNGWCALGPARGKPVAGASAGW